MKLTYPNGVVNVYKVTGAFRGAKWEHLRPTEVTLDLEELHYLMSSPDMYKTLRATLVNPPKLFTTLGVSELVGKVLKELEKTYDSTN